jgi:hypothetical protein
MGSLILLMVSTCVLPTMAKTPEQKTGSPVSTFASNATKEINTLDPQDFKSELTDDESLFTVDGKDAFDRTVTTTHLSSDIQDKDLRTEVKIKEVPQIISSWQDPNGDTISNVELTVEINYFDKNNKKVKTKHGHVDLIVQEDDKHAPKFTLQDYLFVETQQ